MTAYRLKDTQGVYCVEPDQTKRGKIAIRGKDHKIEVSAICWRLTNQEAIAILAHL